MTRWLWTLLLSAASVLQYGAAAPTWPSSVDELEDIMQLNTGYRARGFANPVTPCGKAPGTGRNAAAEFIRTAFHDMATGNVFSGVGGLDASIVFELGGNQGDNIGSAFPSTLTALAPYLSKRSSMADIIALGMYTAVRSCTGPAIAVKAGRVDATEAGPVGVPLPQNSAFTFQNQFARVGFNQTEMIQVVACGHTLGGVHSANFPQIVPPGSAPNEVRNFDTTVKFDERLAVEYTSGTTQDPLVVGPSTNVGRNSDTKVFNIDGNVTIATMTNPTTFQNACKYLLAKMIDVVPSSVTLTDPIVPYDVKPNGLQLTLLAGGSNIQFAGEVRVKTTTRAASQIAKVELVYKDRTGGNGCGACKISTTSKGTAAGFDENYVFYGFSTQLPSSISISSFTVLITLTSGTTETYDNNGNGFPVQDRIMLQSPQSCVTGNKLTVVAAVRSPAPASVSLDLTLKVPRNGLLVPGLQDQSVALTKGATVGDYSLYSGSYTLDSTQVQNTKFDVSIGGGGPADTFKSTGDLEATCSPLGTGGGTTTTSSSTSTYSSTTSSSTTTSSSSTSSSTTTSTTTRPSSTLTTSTTSSAPGPTLAGYTYEGCYTDSSTARVLTGKSSSTSTLTYQSCASYCAGYTYFGVEYGRECYCGNIFSNPTTPVAASDCSFKCAGDNTQICGAGNRMNIFKSTSKSPSNTTVPGYTYAGCYTDSTSDRVLYKKVYFDSKLTIEKCAAACKGYSIFGAEYGSQCYCDNAFSNPTTKVAESDCGYVCGGDPTELCGAGNRLSVYKANP
ncbi:MAG: hypothetical protein LQ351_007661 [Letrouitia transgressa]|nr:MAG: hypothetical protein LQ351_007661 [Letrouitia transgressa]